MITYYLIYIAGAGLLIISLANAFAPVMLRWNINLAKTEVFFQQVFKVHAFYIVMTMLGMAALCFFAADELIAGENTTAVIMCWYMAVFWVVRVVLHLCYYDKMLMEAHPIWNVLFLTGFVYLAVVFTWVAIKQ